MLRKCSNLFLVLGAAIALGSVALAEQGGKSAQNAKTPAAESAGGGGGLQVGKAVNAGRLHRVTRPGLYGMSEAPAGSAYGIVDDRLIRFDPESGRVLSIIRQVDQILD